jgi:TPR repeat protein
MFLQRLACSSVAISLATTTCFGQAYGVPAPYAPRVGNSNRIFQRAQAGDTNAEYLLGMDFERGDGFSGGTPDLATAVSWYKMAAQRGELRATYRIGQLLAEGKASLRPGTPVGASQEQGRKLMQYAVSNGYSPQAGRVITAAEAARLAAEQQAARQQSQNAQPATTSGTSDGALLLFGGIAALLALAAASSDSTSSSTFSGDSSSGMKYCHKYKSVWKDDGHGSGHYEQEYVPAQGFECP